MTYVALLRGINVGGHAKVEMARLKQTFERLGLSNVKTYINSGNVIFDSAANPNTLPAMVEQSILEDFGLSVPVLVRDRVNLEGLVQLIPATWVNDGTMKCDVMFLWQTLDRPEILSQIPHKPEIEDVRYFPGAVIWRINRDQVNRGQVLKIIGTDTYRQMTVRNVNTVRKILELMQS